jgi:hypothetical protein
MSVRNLKVDLQSVVHRDNIVIVRVHNHDVIVRLIGPTLSVADRGDLLLDLEMDLRKRVHPNMQVFLEPKGDLNKLRIKLRGVKV